MALFSIVVNIRWFPCEVDDTIIMMTEVGCVHGLKGAPYKKIIKLDPNPRPGILAKPCGGPYQ